MLSQKRFVVLVLFLGMLFSELWFGSQRLQRLSQLFVAPFPGSSAFKERAIISLEDENDDTTIGYPNLVHLPLLPWEIDSIATRTCHPPEGFPEECCIGSISAGGGVHFQPSSCDKGFSIYEQSEQIALESLEDHPLPLMRISAATTTPCDMCRIVDILLKNNWKLAFEGDSITGQIFSGLECELRRRGFAVDKNITSFWEDKTKPKPRWRYGLDRITELVVRKRPGESTTAIIRLYSMYRPMEDLHEIEQIARDNDILLFDNGLHFGAQVPDEWRQHMTSMIQHFQAQQDSSLKLLLWRETSAQHFNSTGGHFYPLLVKQLNCVPPPDLPQNATEPHFRMVTMKHLMEEFNASTLLQLLPFHEYTKKFYDLHTNAYAGDCTHFCSTPSLWLYLWRHIRLAMETLVHEP